MANQREVRQYILAVNEDYINNYLTVEKFAEHNGLLKNEAIEFLELADKISNHKHPEE